MSRVWTDGVQWLVHLLQKLKKDGTIDHPVRCQTLISRGQCPHLAVSALIDHTIVDGYECRSAASVG
jgi:hypothetical protein